MQQKQCLQEKMATEPIGYRLSERVGGTESVMNLLSWAIDRHGAAISSPSVVLRDRRATSRESGGPGDGTDDALDSDLISVFTCVDDLSANEEVFRIPPSVYLRAESPGKWRDALERVLAEDPDLRRRHAELSERDKLSFRLLLECGDEGSHWRPYIDALPRDDPCLSSWDQESLSLLRGTPIWRSTKCFRDNLDILGEPGSDLAHFASLAASRLPSGNDRPKLRWCHQMVMSRAFGIKYGGNSGGQEENGDPLPTLVPVVDLLDHSNEAKVSWTVGEASGGSFVFRVDAAVPRGGQLFTNYGGKGNEELLRGYGFTLESNPHDFYVIELGVGGSEMRDDPTAWNLRLRLLQLLGCKKSHSLTMSDPFPTALLAAATACVLPQAEVYLSLASLAEGVEAPPLGSWLRAARRRCHALRALEMLRSQIEGNLAKLTEVATIEEDEGGLHGYTSYASESRFRHLMAVHYRLGLKRILREAAARVAEAEKTFLILDSVAGSNKNDNGGGEEESDILEVDLASLGSGAAKAHKTRLMVALDLPMAHFFSPDAMADPAKSLSYLCTCASLMSMKVEKLGKLGSEGLLERSDELERVRARLRDKVSAHTPFVIVSTQGLTSHLLSLAFDE